MTLFIATYMYDHFVYMYSTFEPIIQSKMYNTKVNRPINISLELVIEVTHCVCACGYALCACHLQTLEPSDEDQKLIEMSDSEEVLKETCPAEYSSLQEKDVRSLCLYM